MQLTNRVWSRSLLGFAILLMLSGVTAVVSADEAAPAPTRMEILAQHIEAGDLEYHDSKTGEIVVATEARVAEIRSRLEPHFDRPQGARVDVADDGTVSADIDGAMRDVFIVRTRLDGTRETGCFRDVDAAVAFIVGLDIYASKRSGGGVPREVVE